MNCLYCNREFKNSKAMAMHLCHCKAFDEYMGKCADGCPPDNTPYAPNDKWPRKEEQP